MFAFINKRWSNSSNYLKLERNDVLFTFTYILNYPNYKKGRNLTVILLSIFLHNFRSIFTHFSLFCPQKQCGNSTQKGTAEFVSSDQIIVTFTIYYTMENFQLHV